MEGLAGMEGLREVAGVPAWLLTVTSGPALAVVTAVVCAVRRSRRREASAPARIG